MKDSLNISYLLQHTTGMVGLYYYPHPQPQDSGCQSGQQLEGL